MKLTEEQAAEILAAHERFAELCRAAGLSAPPASQTVPVLVHGDTKDGWARASLCGGLLEVLPVDYSRPAPQPVLRVVGKCHRCGTRTDLLTENDLCETCEQRG
jgi:hypothetical protein